jgi:hypothetical protein
MKLIAAAALLAAGSVQAQALAEYVEGDARIELHRDAGPCVDNARWAVFFRGMVRVSGCWILAGGVVQIAWLDGDVSQVPLRVFREPRSL